MISKEDLRGKRFNRLIIVSRVDPTKNSRAKRWLCLCDCGKFKKVSVYSLKNGAIKSCGCLRKEVLINRMHKHGDSPSSGESRLYIIWQNMKARCYNPNGTRYNKYGKRGIEICPGWKDNYIAFKFWAILSGYQDDLTIDRIDNDGNYEPNNCQWITKSESSIKTNKQRSVRCP